MGIPFVNTALSLLHREKIVSKIVVCAGGVQIKIEVTPVLRGCVYEPTVMAVTPAVESAFGFAEIQTVSFADLYAGKIVAALDRQHPRDLFDVRDLLANEGISDELRIAFLIYLVSHDRTIAEVLSPTRKKLDDEFTRGFDGMTAEPVALADLLAARENLIEAMVKQMPSEHHAFLRSFKRGKPDWSLLNLPHAKDLPAVQWKLRNLALLSAERRASLIGHLTTFSTQSTITTHRRVR